MSYFFDVFISARATCVACLLALLAPVSAQSSCLDTATSIEMASPLETDYLFEVSGLAVDARGVLWLGLPDHAIQPAGSWPGCWVGGNVQGPYGDASVYECLPEHCPGGVCPDPCLAYHTTAGLRVDIAAPTVVEDLRVGHYGDGVESSVYALREPLLVRGAYLHDLHDDAVENDWGASVTVIDSLLERVNTAFASRPRSSANIDASDQTFAVRDSLILLHHFPNTYQMKPGHGHVWKWDNEGRGPNFVVTGSTFVVTAYSGTLILPLVDQLLECEGNTLLWADGQASWNTYLNDDEIRSDGLDNAGRVAALADCYQFVVKPDGQSQADFLAEHFDPLVDAWKASHAAAGGVDGGGNPPAPECSDGLDNDGDGNIDFPADAGCSDYGDGSEDSDAPAWNDADGDGWDIFEDCDDTDWWVNPGASELCDDGIDNDCDGKIDCADRKDCKQALVCTAGGGPGDPGSSGPEICDDGIDNDGDGKTDCSDKPDCRKDPACN